MTVVLSPKKVAKQLSIVVLCLVVASIVGQVALNAMSSKSHHGLAELAGKFNLDSELNIPTWYQSVTLLACSVLLGAIAATKNQLRSPFAKHWTWLAVTFLFMSLDEMAALHEMLIVPLRRYLGAEGMFYYAWVIPAIVFVVGFAIAYLRFLFVHLDSRTRWRFIAAGTIYVAGALGMEMAEGPIDQMFGVDSFWAKAAVTVEETLEMVGIAVFIYTLLSYIASHVGVVRIGVCENIRLAQTRPIVPRKPTRCLDDAECLPVNSKLQEVASE